MCKYKPCKPALSRSAVSLPSGSAPLAVFRFCFTCVLPALLQLLPSGSADSASVLSPLCNRRKKTLLDLVDQNDRLAVRTGKRYKATCHRSMPAAVSDPCSASAVILPASREDFSLRTDSLMPSPLLEYTTEKETSTSASIKSETLAINASGQSSPYRQS